MKITKIIQISASLLLTCGLIRAAEWVDPLANNANGEEISKIETTVHCTLPCGSNQH